MARRFLADERGATTIEYSVIAGMMLVVVVGIASTGESLTALYESVGLISQALGDGDASAPALEIGGTPPA